MGIRDLWEIVSPSRQIISLEAFAYQHFISTGQFLKIGVDISQWFSQFQTGLRSKHIRSHAQLGQNPELRNMFLRISRFSQLPVILLAVFDGPDRPGRKRKKSVRAIPHWMTARTVDILRAFGHYSITAPGEAEAELSHLNQLGRIDAVLTDDSDALVFGAQKIIRNATDKKHPDVVAIYDASDFPSQKKTPIMSDGFLLFALLQGGDYSAGIDHCGKVTAHALTNTSLGTTLRFASKDYTNTELQNYLNQKWTPALKHHLEHDPDSFIGSKRPKAASSIPAGFPDINTVRHYVSPLVSPGPFLPLPNTADDVDVPYFGMLSDQLFSWGLDGIIMTKFERSVWPAVCIRKLAKGQTDHVIGLSNVKKSQSGILVHIEFDIVWLFSLTTARLSGLSATHDRTTMKLWVPAGLIAANSPFVSRLRNEYVQKAQTISVRLKIQLLDSAYDVFDPTLTSTLTSTGVTQEDEKDDSDITDNVIDLTSDDNDSPVENGGLMFIDLTLDSDDMDLILD
ncbi:PIN domain-like protein [Dendrothele bispora CBS 962.96]|uniref:PIN domain-like protein n=1 Tax=Dendrothele bispora (strain CBS 962.96) TaxID=1314807 RepID=A0A4S8KVH8_DENBC|nr:PIN domain-like protein [Dendrothele bispora CBS 962.96]